MHCFLHAPNASEAIAKPAILIVADRPPSFYSYARALAAVSDWCRTHRHLPEQHAQLVAKMRGHYAYYGISGNIRRLSWYAYQVRRIWQKWLSRRGSRFPWDRYIDLLKRYPLPAPRIVHRYTAVSEALP
jgi:RNA-directed DNA polymerase